MSNDGENFCTIMQKIDGKTVKNYIELFFALCENLTGVTQIKVKDCMPDHAYYVPDKQYNSYDDFKSNFERINEYEDYDFTVCGYYKGIWINVSFCAVGDVVLSVYRKDAEVASGFFNMVQSCIPLKGSIELHKKENYMFMGHLFEPYAVVGSLTWEVIATYIEDMLNTGYEISTATVSYNNDDIWDGLVSSNYFGQHLKEFMSLIYRGSGPFLGKKGEVDSIIINGSVDGVEKNITFSAKKGREITISSPVDSSKDTVAGNNVLASKELITDIEQEVVGVTKDEAKPEDAETGVEDSLAADNPNNVALIKEKRKTEGKRHGFLILAILFSLPLLMVFVFINEDPDVAKLFPLLYGWFPALLWWLFFRKVKEQKLSKEHTKKQHKTQLEVDKIIEEISDGRYSDKELLEIAIADDRVSVRKAVAMRITTQAVLLGLAKLSKKPEVQNIVVSKMNSKTLKQLSKYEKQCLAEFTIKSTARTVSDFEDLQTLMERYKPIKLVKKHIEKDMDGHFRQTMSDYYISIYGRFGLRIYRNDNASYNLYNDIVPFLQSFNKDVKIISQYKAVLW